VACAAGKECTSGLCVDGVCCNAACSGACNACDLSGSEGQCTPRPKGAPGEPLCGGYLCNGNSGGCPSSCVEQADCAGTHYCDAANACQPKKTTGLACGGAEECVSGFCVDGFCCNGACSGGCDTCDQGGKEGQCLPLVQ